MSVFQLERLDLRFEPKPWHWADARRAEIDAHFAAAQRANPRLWNGRVLVLHRHRLEAGALSGAFLETDYASFHYWLRHDRPDAGVSDCFGAAAVMGSDGAFLMAQMAAHTANAGRIYFPCGTPDPSDVIGDGVDFGHSIARELREETGLDAAEFSGAAGWTVLEQRNRIVAYKVLRGRETAQALSRQVIAHMAKEPNGELAAVRLVRGLADLDPAMPDYVTEFLRHHWNRAGLPRPR